MIRSGLVSILLLSILSFAGAESAEKESRVDPVSKLNREIVDCRQKAVDLRVLGLNALKNSDAARSKAHDELVEAMGGSDSSEIDKARDLLDESCRKFEDALENVGELIGCILKAEMSLKKADAAAKNNSADSGSTEEIDLSEVKKQVKSAYKYLEKAEDRSFDLKRAWLEPYFISTSTTTTSTTTTTASEAATVVKP